MAICSRRRSISFARLQVLTVLVCTVAGVSPSAGQAVAAGQVSFPPETTCIAVMLPSVQGVDGSATEVAAAVRELFTSYLTGPSLRTVPLEARLASQAIEEARQKDCGQVLLATLTRKRSGGGALGRALGQAAGTAAWSVPGVAGTGGAVARGAVIAGAQAVSSLAGSTKAKDEMRLDYKISPLDAAVSAKPETLKVKAAADGEDILTPLVEKASEAIAAGLAKK
ncbi:MAG: hypothetical protein EHM24_14045 [Acidobacteria bacterium]|nr:MAG: hypothetical protein EHM24_14045 [Acidobacteriota bacterium]